MTRTRLSSVDEYIASKPKDVRPALQAVRRAIRRAAPAAQEGLAYQMPAYTLNGAGLLYFAGWKAHYSIYPASDAMVAAFARELAPYGRSKGTLRFPLSEPVPVRLIERITRFRAQQLKAASRGTRRGQKAGESLLARVRRLCAALPSVFEKTSHGMPTFFVDRGKGSFAVVDQHHRDDGRLALWAPVADGLQDTMIEEAPSVYFRPPYVGAGGWIGILLDEIGDDALAAHLREAWRLIAARRKAPRRRPPTR